MKRRAWRWVLAIVAGLALSIGGILWSAHRRADAVLGRQDRRAGEIIAAIRARSYRRALLYPPAKPGDGWVDYLKGLAGIDGIPRAEIDELPDVRGEADFVADPETLEEFFEKHEPLIELFRESNRRTEFKPDYRYEDGSAMVLNNVTSVMTASRLLGDRAAHFADSGRGAGALESVLLGLSVAQDTGRGGVVINHLVMIVGEGILAERCRQLLKEESFRAEELVDFAGKLDLLAGTRPDLVDVYEAEEACVIRTLADLAGSPLSEPRAEGALWGRSWRYLYSRRLACAGALTECERLFQRCRGLRGLEPHRRPVAMESILRDAEASTNPIVKQMMPAITKVCLRDSVSQVALTLMRVSTAVAWYQAEKGAWPDSLDQLVPRHLPRVPVCPLTGKPLGYREGRIWSPGRNGIDDGGKSGKDDEIDAPDGDYVWTVKPK